jgi:hypothetical protein
MHTVKFGTWFKELAWGEHADLFVWNIWLGKLDCFSLDFQVF